ncbi:DNA sulfur modification protein DndD [Nonomuraea sp. FMUSA5-5]|uniref:Nuclease SbcCD subunit C n=1 Tax=Nonomuraea composti TaxID=2720023 RepID=A0ABX1BFU8_9ACTN|nr:DNA sulfur modification protein DndD [Nonomuraea sp. FMUSA5-5]NJP96638.1 DNA sulfur modification protein DndD [Nonomuraea sp. FMUSA5-5]
MIFQELVLTNVGPFAGRQAIRLAPKEPDHPIVLFGGLNGAGKTTVLEALLLVLYGTMTPGSSRRATSYEKYLTQLIHSATDPADGASIELLFRAIHNGAWQEFQLIRRWAVVSGKVRERVDVNRDGYPDQILSEGWADHVETLVPRGVANLFFFDGEQIEAFAESDVSQELVRTAVSALLGLDLVDRLQDDLTVLERRHRQEATSDEDREAIVAKQRELQRLRSHEIDLMQELETTQRKLQLATQDATEARVRLHREGMQQYQERDRLTERLHAAQASVKASRQALIDAVGGFGPLLLVPDLLASTTAQAIAEQEQADNHILNGLLSERDNQLLEHLRAQRASAKIQTAVAQFLSEDRNSREARARVDPLLGHDETTLALAKRLLDEDLESIRSDLRHRVAELEAARAALEASERAAAAIPHEDVGEALVAEYEKANKVVASLRAHIDLLNKELAATRSTQQAAERAFKQELKSASEKQLQTERLRRIVEHAGRARATLVALRAKATERHVKRIQSMVLESLQLLLRKDNLVHEVNIDPDTCEMELLTQDGRPVRPRSLSAGERQLLAVALLAGLARASGRMLPVVIDTPLGRLDSDHRMRFVQSYLPNASHQVIVLSTDTEITPDILDTLDGVISHTIRLEHDIERRVTHVSEGYFNGATGTQQRKEVAR